jgi:hypothetical protein
MDQQNNEVAHPGNSINTSIAAPFRLIWQFSMGRQWRHLSLLSMQPATARGFGEQRLHELPL